MPSDIRKERLKIDILRNRRVLKECYKVLEALTTGITIRR
jgi:hypothetical protein